MEENCHLRSQSLFLYFFFQSAVFGKFEGWECRALYGYSIHENMQIVKLNL